MSPERPAKGGHVASRARHALLVTLAMAVSPSALADGEPAPWRSLRADLDGDGAVERVAVWREDLVAREPGAEVPLGFLVIGEGPDRTVSPSYPIWAIRVADLDGDRAAEILLGLWSRRQRKGDADPHRTISVLIWDGRQLVERWRGPALGRPVADFALVDLDADGRHELLTIEHPLGRPRGCAVSLYRWSGRGFRGAVRADRPCRRPGLCADDGSCVNTDRGPARPRLERGGRRLVLEPRPES